MISSVFSSDDWFTLLIRLGSALLIGACVGWVRQTAGKAAGVRTHMLVTVTSALLVVIPLQLHAPPPDEPVSYVLQGISTGIGFLGAGMILRQPDTASCRVRVKGLTSASEIWVSASLGASVACGLWFTAIVGTVLMLFILTVVKEWEKFITVKVEDEC